MPAREQSEGLKALAKRSGLLVAAVRAVRSVPLIARRAVGRLRRPGQVRRYAPADGVRKLHLGCGANVLAGWLNTDIDPALPTVTYLDAARGMPFADAAFDRIFAEHLIEHLCYEDALAMLGECRRTLAGGGRIRICTPDLRRIVALLNPDRTDIEDRFIRWQSDWCFPGRQTYEPALVINHYLRAWGHKLIYDRDTLQRLLREAGFVHIVACAPGQSDDDHFHGIDAGPRKDHPPGMAEFETMILEASAAS